jgi:hypothetical protein
MINEIFALLFVYFNLNQRLLNQDYDFNSGVIEQTHQSQTGHQLCPKLSADSDSSSFSELCTWRSKARPSRKKIGWRHN